MRNSVGTLRWTRETNGMLRPRDRVRLLGQGVLLQLRSFPPSLRRTLGLRTSRLARFDLDRLQVPDSAASREAEELCAEAPMAIVNHSHRSYVWGSILAAHDRIHHDIEFLYIGALLHDIGFAEPRRTRYGQPCCFTVTGANAALDLGARFDWDEQRREALAEAITLHLNLHVGREHGPEAQLLYVGTRLDATGFRYWDLDPETVGAVLARYPRLAMKHAFVEMMDRQAQGTPGSRAHFYTRYLRGNRFISRAPFEE
jgi:hypothetical protein